jgi:hypothetical protein
MARFLDFMKRRKSFEIAQYNVLSHNRRVCDGPDAGNGSLTRHRDPRSFRRYTNRKNKVAAKQAFLKASGQLPT